MPCGKENVCHYTDPALGARLFSQRFKYRSWSGFAEVDIEIPDPIRPKFEDMCPFSYNEAVPVEAVPQQMLDYFRSTGRKGTAGTVRPPPLRW